MRGVQEMHVEKAGKLLVFLILHSPQMQEWANFARQRLTGIWEHDPGAHKFASWTIYMYTQDMRKQAIRLNAWQSCMQAACALKRVPNEHSH